MDGDKVHLAARVLFLEQAVVELGHHTIDIIADNLGGAGGNDGHHLHLGVAHQQHVHGFFHAVGGAEYRAVFVHRGRSDFKIILEVLRKQQAHKHDATLAAMNNGDAVLDANARVLRAAGLTGEYGIDDPCPFLFHNFARHGSSLCEAGLARRLAVVKSSLRLLTGTCLSGQAAYIQGITLFCPCPSGETCRTRARQT